MRSSLCLNLSPIYAVTDLCMAERLRRLPLGFKKKLFGLCSSPGSDRCLQILSGSKWHQCSAKLGIGGASLLRVKSKCYYEYLCVLLFVFSLVLCTLSVSAKSSHQTSHRVTMYDDKFIYILLCTMLVVTTKSLNN